MSGGTAHPGSELHVGRAAGRAAVTEFRPACNSALGGSHGTTTGELNARTLNYQIILHTVNLGKHTYPSKIMYKLPLIRK